MHFLFQHITHLTFAIIGAIFAAIMFILSLIYTVAYWSVSYVLITLYCKLIGL